MRRKAVALPRRRKEPALAKITPGERARRALTRAIDTQTELVAILKDPGDQDSDPTHFQVVPEDLLDKTFMRVGLDDEQEMQAVKAGLIIQLPEIKDFLKEKLKLKPTVEIGLVWEISDDGRGFTDAADNALADGIRNLKKRLSDMGGECVITTRPGEGTLVRFEIPWSAAAWTQ